MPNTPPDPPPPDRGRVLVIALAIPVGLALVVGWFGWTAEQTKPRDLPIVVAGPSRITQGVVGQLSQAQPGAFAITQVGTEAEADAALREHSAYGAIVVGTAGVSMHIASGASPALAERLRQLAQQLGGQQLGGPPVTVVDVVPASPDDPTGGGFAAGFLPLVLAGMAAGVLLVLLVRRRTSRLLGLLGFAVLAGLVGAGVMHWLHILTGNYLVTAAAIALLAVAVSAGVSGLGALLGRPGLALGVLLVFLFGNPIAAVAVVPELLPQPWGAVGQLLPAGAGVTLLRAVAFYDGADSLRPLLTLAAWAVVGVTLLLLGRASTAGQAPSSNEDG
jgi:ABC-2 family transporter